MVRADYGAQSLCTLPRSARVIEIVQGASFYSDGLPI